MRTLLLALFVFVLFLVPSIHSSLLLSVFSLEDGNVLCTLKNTASDPERFLQYNTPFDSGVFASILKVTDRVGKEAKYIGKVGKRVFPPPESSYLTLESGESISAVINIHELYHVHEEGVYRISGRVPEGTRAEIGESAMQYLEKSAETVKESKAALGNSFSECSTEEQTTVEKSRVSAEQYTYESSKCLDENTCDFLSAKWFSATNSVNGDNYDHAKGIFTKLKPALASVNIECNNEDCRPNTFAFVYPKDENQIIYLCPVFWSTSDPSERPQTLIHEYSHFDVIGSTLDYRYGTTECLNLAATNSTEAVRNADNIGYFAIDVGESGDFTASIPDSMPSDNNDDSTASSNGNNDSSAGSRLFLFVFCFLAALAATV